MTTCPRSVGYCFFKRLDDVITCSRLLGAMETLSLMAQMSQLHKSMPLIILHRTFKPTDQSLDLNSRQFCPHTKVLLTNFVVLYHTLYILSQLASAVGNNLFAVATHLSAYSYLSKRSSKKTPKVQLPLWSLGVKWSCLRESSALRKMLP